MTPEEIDAAAVVALDRAAQAIKTKGWTQGELEDDRGRLCSIGGLRYSTRQSQTYNRARRRLMAAIRLETGLTLAPVGWNDAYCGSGDEAVHMLCEAASLGSDKVDALVEEMGLTT